MNLKYWLARIDKVRSPKDLAHIIVDLYDAYVDEYNKNKQLMDGLEEYLTNHRDENYIREIYNHHKSGAK